MCDYSVGMNLRGESYPVPPGLVVSYVESEWHRISAELETERAMTRLADMLDREPCWDDVRDLASVREVELDQSGRLMRLMATRRLSSFLDGETVRDIVDIVGQDEPADVMAERTARHEVGLVLGRTKDQAQFLVGVYRRLVSEFPHFVAALTAGQITLGHCYAVHEETLTVTDPAALARIAGRALPFAQAQSVTRFRTSVRRLIARHDPNAAERRRQARLQRRVAYSNLGDGISSMTVVARTEDVEAMRESIDDAAISLMTADRARAEQDEQQADGDAAGDGGAAGEVGSSPQQNQPPLTTGQARSDAVVAALLGTVDAHGTVTYAPREHRRTRLELVADVHTVAGITDNLARLGEDPICAGVARALLLDVDVVARALVADGTAHLLDLGQDIYLSDKQRTYIRNRDRTTCRCCGRRATRGEMDHLVPYLRGGPSAPWNEWWVCRECHQRKTADQLTVDGRTDHAVQITTPSGIVYYSSPPPYLDDPDRDSHLAAQAPPVSFTLPAHRRRRPTPDLDDDIPPF